MNLHTLESKNNLADKRPTIQTVADALGMHKSTISVALSGKGTLSKETRDRILTAARTMGYVPNPIAQRLASGYTNSEVPILCGILDVGLATEKILMIQRELSNLSLEVPIYKCSESNDQNKELHALQTRQICKQLPRAIVCAVQMLDELVYEELRAYQNAGGFVVSYDYQIPLQCDQVIFDREHNAYIAAKHLLDNGHRRIGLALSNRVDWLTEPSSFQHSDRLNGFRKALQEYECPLNEDWIFQHSTYEKGGEELAFRFLQMKERPTALCIVNDYVALAFMVTAMRNGVRIPEDLSVVGHDNQEIAKYCPVPLTSATQPKQQITSTVVSLLANRLKGNAGPPQSIKITGELVERQSVAAI